MAAALAGAGGGGALVAVVPLHVDEEIDSRITPLCVGVAEVKEAAAALKLKMRVNDRHEVFQLWELPDEEEEEQDFSSSLLNKLQRGGQIEGQKQLVGFPLYYRGPPSFDLEEESTIQSARHTTAPAAQLEWSANVMSVKVLACSPGFPINLYGSVWVRDDLDRQRVYLFRRDRDNAQSLKSPEETLVLTGPSRGLLVFDNLFFEIDLKMRCDQQANDMDFSQGRIHYSNHMTKKSKLITDKLTTKASTVAIKFAPIRRAVEATIQIEVPKECSVELYGKISAVVTGISEEVVLFDSEASGTAIKIGDGGVELWRQVVSVPVDGCLLLMVDTWEGDCRANLSRSATPFTPQIHGQAAASIHRVMQVKVLWSALYISEFDDKHLFGLVSEF